MDNSRLNKRPQAVTMRDVARKANVSQSTVSRIISGTDSKIPISEETRQKVMHAIQEMGYHPNQYARSLRGSKIHMIGMVIADIGNPFYHPMVRAVQDIALQNGYDVMIANSDHMREKEMLFCESIVRRPVDGVIMIPYHLTDQNLENLIQRTGVTISAVGNHIRHPDIDVTFADDFKATYETIRWLIDVKKHQRIAMIHASRIFPVTVRRASAFYKAMEESNLPVPKEYVIERDWEVKTGQEGIKSLLSLPNPPTAVFCASDTIAIGALEMAETLGVRVPQDIAIVGFDDIPAASWVRPRLSTIAQHPDQMGFYLANSLFERLRGEYSGPGRRFEVPCELIIREST